MIVGSRLNQGRYPVVEKHNEPRIVAYMPVLTLQEVGRRIWQVRDWLRERGLEKNGHPACVYTPWNGWPTGSMEDHRCEVQWALALAPQEAALQGNGEVSTKCLGPELVLSTFHQGDTELIDESFAFLKQVLREEGYTESGPHREIYLFDVCLPKSRWITEIQIPVLSGKRLAGCLVAEA